jgi:hypothetical protein
MSAMTVSAAFARCDLGGDNAPRDRLVASFVSCDRGCLPVLTALSMSEPDPVFAGSDRSHGAEVHWHRREAGVGQGQRLARRHGQVRSELTNIDFAGSRGAVVTHEQLRSEFGSGPNFVMSSAAIGGRSAGLAGYRRVCPVT